METNPEIPKAGIQKSTVVHKRYSLKEKAVSVAVAAGLTALGVAAVDSGVKPVSAEGPKEAPTATLTPPQATSTADTIRLTALGKEQAYGKMTATAVAVATVKAAPTATKVPGNSGNKTNEDGGIPGFFWGIGAAAGGVFAWTRRQAIAQFAIANLIKAANWVRTRTNP